MNAAQLIRKARQGIDAILPGGSASAQWQDDESLAILNEAMESVHREFRLVHQKWGMVTLNYDDDAFTQEGETYTPSSELSITSSRQKVTLPPDVAEIVRITSPSHSSYRFIKADAESSRWIDLEKDSTSVVGIPVEPLGLTFYWDLIGYRTLFFTPVVSGTVELEIDYIPMFRPLYYSNAGSVAVTNSSTTITGTSTTWVTDNIFSEASGQRCELIVGTNSLQSNTISLVKDYPRVASITSNTAATFKSNYGGTTTSGAPALMVMAPTLPREYHQWIARVASALMLSKINPDLSDKYHAKYMQQFRNEIQPSIRRRQSQESRVTEDSEEMGFGEA